MASLSHLLLVSAGFSYGMQFVNFYLSCWHHLDNFTGFIEFVPAAVYGFWSARNDAGWRPILSTAALLIWSLRLTFFLLNRMKHRPARDSRMDDMFGGRNVQMLKFWLAHGTWGVVVSLPVTLLNASADAGASTAAVAPSDLIGLASWLVGFCIQAVADSVKLQCHVGRRRRYYSMDGHWMWHYTRNPNFLGEVLCWAGLALVACGQLGLLSWRGLLSWASPGMTLVIMLGEAALLSEVKNSKRFGADVEYKLYRLRTSLLWPCPPSLYIDLPQWVRTCLFFDWAIYQRRIA